MNKRQLLDHLRRDIYVRIGVSTMHGVGLIAVRDIPKGINPFINPHSEKCFVYTIDEINSLPDYVRKMIHDYCGQEGNQVYVPVSGVNSLDLLHYINHSDNPNVKTEDGDAFVTTRDIKKGEELFSDYSTYDVDYEQKF